MQTLKPLNKKLSYTPVFALTILAISAIFFSCNKKFDEPPVFEEPNITVTLSIAALKAMHTTGNVESITDDQVIGGIVVADDRSGNFYKSIIIQDETGGISVKLDGYNLYTTYPVGRKIYIKVKGLYLGDYNQLIELGGGVDNSGIKPQAAAVASSLFDTYLVKGSLDNPVTPVLVKVADLNNTYQNTLIQLENFEFSSGDTSKTFADTTITSSAINYTIKSCSGESIILRNSSYAGFAGNNLPNGNGTITAIYTIYGTTKQLYIRDTSDVKFYSERCAGGGSGTGGFISISDLRKLYSGSDISLGSYMIKGIVISDAAAGNVSPGNIILQDADHGIDLYYGSSAATSKFNPGDSLVADVSGGTLTSYNGTLEIKLSSSSLPASAAATGKTVTPKELTIQQLNAALPDMEYTLVKINNATATSGTYGGNKTLTDATGNITLYTSIYATFASANLPADAKNWTGYANVYNTTHQFQIRNTSDVTDAGANPPPPPPPNGSDLIFSEYVEGTSNNKYLEIYNASASAADLSKYIVKLYANGGVTATNQAQLDTLTGITSLTAGALIVLKNSSAALSLPAGIMAYSSNVCNFNGDDAITIEKDGAVIDVFGEIGSDPGTSWTISGSTSAALDKTVRRKSTVSQGNTNWTNSAAAEWDVITTTDDVSGLGKR